MVHKGADGVTATAKDQLRKRLWADLLLYLQVEHDGESALAELERLHIA
jgi:hypothetical protein